MAFTFGLKKPKAESLVEEKYDFPVITLGDKKKNQMVLNQKAIDALKIDFEQFDSIKIAITIDNVIPNSPLFLVNTSHSPLNNSAIEFNVHKSTGNTFNSKRIYDRIIKEFGIEIGAEISCSYVYQEGFHSLKLESVLENEEIVELVSEPIEGILNQESTEEDYEEPNI